MRVLGFAALLIVFVVAACAPPASQEGSAIAARSDDWEVAFQAGDIEALVGFYTDDVKFLPPHGELARGHAAVRSILGELIDAGLTGELTTLEAVVAGDVGYNVGTFSLETSDGAAVDRGKFIETWRLVDGEWKISNDIFNSDMPATDGGGPTAIAIHEVGDVDKWKAAWQGEVGLRQLFAEKGASNVRLFQSEQEPSLTGLLMQVEDLEAVKAMLTPPEGYDAAVENDGIKMDTMRLFTEVE